LSKSFSTEFGQSELVTPDDEEEDTNKPSAMSSVCLSNVLVDIDAVVVVVSSVTRR